METFPLFSISSLNNSLSVLRQSYDLSVVMDCLLILQFSHPNFFFQECSLLEGLFTFWFLKIMLLKKTVKPFLELK